MLICVLLFAAGAYADRNAISAYLGINDAMDIRYDRYAGDFGIGISPGLGGFLYAKVLSSGSSHITWYDPALHLRYRFKIAGTKYLIPEAKIFYTYWDDYFPPDRRHSITSTYGFAPRLYFSIPFRRMALDFYAGLLEYTLSYWNENALNEYRPLPRDGFRIDSPVLGISVGYLF